MDRLQRLFQQASALGGRPQMPSGQDVPTQDTAEQIHISSLALLKVFSEACFYICWAFPEFLTFPAACVDA